MRHIAARTALLAPILAAAACVDALGTAEREPVKLEVNEGVPVSVTEGTSIPVPIRVLDSHGRAFDRLPPWLEVAWTTSDTSLAVINGVDVTGRNVGQTVANVRIGELRATTRIRVNPVEVGVTVDGVQLMQSIQRADGGVPVAADREAILRVFVRADRLNFFDAGVRVHVYNGDVLRQTFLLDARDAGIPVVIDEGVLASTWNLVIPEHLVQPGLGVTVDADHGGVLPRIAGSITTYPASGEIRRLDVRRVPDLSVRFVPVRLSSTGAQGNVSPLNVDAFLADLRRMYPVRNVIPDIRTPYTTDRTDVTTSEWSAILSEVRFLRLADGNTSYYYGVLRQRSGQPIGGIGYVGGTSALGHDLMPHASYIYAHELGHNFGRWHSPCGEPASIDPAYPHEYAALGGYGIDVAAHALIPSHYKDVMSYCSPRWVSDYTYEAILAHRAARAAALAGVSQQAAQPSLLVWGRISDGEIILEPAFHINAVPSLPRQPGEYVLEGRDALGAPVFSISFDGDVVDHAASGERHFAFAIPLTGSAAARLSSIRMSGAARQASRTASARAATAAGAGSLAAPPPVALVRKGAAALSVQWDAAVHPMVMLRDPRTGDILSLARGGRLELQGSQSELEVIVSDGVRSSASLVRVQ